MRGSVNYQINRLFLESGIFTPGASRHSAKKRAKAQLALMDRLPTPSLLAERTGLFSYSYAEDCKDCWHAVAHHARNAHRLRDMTQLRGIHVESWLLKRIADGIAYRTWLKEAAHAGKLEVALRKFGEQSQVAPQDFGILTATRD